MIETARWRGGAPAAGFGFMLVWSASGAVPAASWQDASAAPAAGRSRRVGHPRWWFDDDDHQTAGALRRMLAGAVNARACLVAATPAILAWIKSQWRAASVAED
ncbi:hypothetical protein ABLN72_12835 [Mycobacterium tuberculosis]